MLLSASSVVLALYSSCAIALSAPSNNGYVHGSSNLHFAPRHPHPHARPRQSVDQDASCAPYWMENIKHQGIASYNPNPGNYSVFRNVKSFGAVGDGVHDDTAAIQRAISYGGRCAPGTCGSSTNQPAVVYFPGGTYKISSAIIDYYYTQIIGNPNCLPTIQAASNFSGSSFGLIDGSLYGDNGLGFNPTVTFFRQIRNLIIDTTKMSAKDSPTGIHWPTAQATSIQNVIFNMNAENGTQHQGLFVEAGSGGFMTDLVFNGGNKGFIVGNQQFTTRNITFNHVTTAIEQLWDWGWTYKSVSINNCHVGLNMTNGGPSAVNVGSITFFDSEITNTPIGIVTSRTKNSEPAAAGSLYVENVKLDNVRTAVAGPNGTYLAGSSGASTIEAWADGHRYLPQGPVEVRGALDPTKRPAELLGADGKYYERSKPQYGDVPLSQFLSARDLGATGNGRTDDTDALNAAILQANAEGKILFIDAGYYLVTSTIYIPPGATIIGEALASVILSSGAYFNDMANPKPVVQIARPGEQGRVELSDLFVSTKGAQAGAILIEYNLGTYTDEPAGLWDVHARIGGFVGSDQQVKQCGTTPNITTTAANLKEECIVSYMTMHLTKFSAGLYMENNWLWTSDHDLDGDGQLTLYAGRGLLVESINGRIWLTGTAVEHHVLYEYQFVDTKNIFMGQIQTETAYYQPNPDATLPFPNNPALSDPVFTHKPMNGTNSTSTSTASGWGLRILRSNNILGYGIGLYSFFNNYSTNCSRVTEDEKCQSTILSIEGGRNTYDINLYNVNTVGSTEIITRDGVELADNKDNNSTFADTVNVFRIGSLGLDLDISL